MRRFAQVENKIIVNVIVANEEFIAASGFDFIECPDEFGVGDIVDKGKFKHSTVIINDLEA